MFEHFVLAQDPVYDRVKAELGTGRKATHWMWFIFPQIHGLAMSPMSQRYAIHSLDEARHYLDHPVLGPRLRECTALVNASRGSPINAIFGHPDDVKFRSSMTLFANAADDAGIFGEALDIFFAGEQDPETLRRI
jgi:uncharacterized protein (DUF1810 family)